MSNTIDDARRLIESRLTEIDAEAKSLERAIAGMGKGSGSQRRRPGRPRRTAATAASAKPKAERRARRKAARAPRGQRREQLLAAIKADPGALPADLAKTIGIPSSQVHALIAKARAEKLIVKRAEGYALRT